MTHEYLSDFQKGQIIALWKVHGIYQKVADELHLPYNTVRSFIQRYHTRRSIENLPRSGAPRKLSQRTTSRLRRTSRKSRRTTLAKLRDDIAPYVSTRTVSRALAVGGIKKHPLAPRPQLTPIDARRRLAWAREHANWKDEDWQGVIWSDECSVEKSKDPRSHWVFRSAAERYHPDCVKGTKSGPDVKLMVWGCFYWNSRGPFVPITTGNMNSHTYLDILQTHLLPVLQDVESRFGDPLFVQDNATSHSACIVGDWLFRSNVNVEKWPPRSPDLNPIEHVWKRLKELLHEMYPDIAETKGGPDAVKKRLAEVLPIVWEQIDNAFLEGLVKSMPRRVQAVIAAHGWNAKY